MHSENCSILFSFGEGGHAAQMNRLAPEIILRLKDSNIISLSDVVVKPTWSCKHYTCAEFRSKYSFLEFLTSNSAFQIISVLRSINRENKINAVVSTGPGLCVLAAIYFRFIRLNVKIIHVETWSRFKTKSMAGKVMYLLADRFYVQHKSLLSLYPKAIYSGLL